MMVGLNECSSQPPLSEAVFSSALIVVVTQQAFGLSFMKETGPSSQTYQSLLLHALRHHQKDVLGLVAAVVEGFLDGDQQLVFDVVAQHPAATNTSGSHDVIQAHGLVNLPVFFTVSVCKGDDVGGSAAAVTDDHGHRRLLPQTLQHDGDHVGPAFQDQTHHRNTMTKTWHTHTHTRFCLSLSVLDTAAMETAPDVATTDVC